MIKRLRLIPSRDFCLKKIASSLEKKNPVTNSGDQKSDRDLA